MAAILAVVEKVLVIMFLILVGYWVTRRGMLTDRGAGEITSLLIKVVTPCVIVNSFIGSGGSLEYSQLLMAVALPAVWMALSLGASLWCSARSRRNGRRCCDSPFYSAMWDLWASLWFKELWGTRA